MASSNPINSLQSITDAWGKWFAKNVAKNSGGCVFTASTNYKSVKALANSSKINNYIQQYQVVATPVSMNYGEPTNVSTPESVTSYSKKYSNNTSATQQTSLTATQATTQTVTWSVTVAINIGAQLTMTVGLPSIADVEASEHWDLTMSTTGETSKTFQRTWSNTETVTVEPHTGVALSLIVTEQTATYPWTSVVRLTGSVAIGFKNKVALPNNKNSKNDLYFIPINDVFTQCLQNKIIGLNGYSINAYASPPNVSTGAQGTLTGGGGITSSTYLTEEPVGSPAGTQPKVVPFNGAATAG